MGYKIENLPAGTTPREAYDTMIANVESGGAWQLPSGYRVRWTWRNAPHLPLRSDDFTKTVIESARGGFREIMIERLKADRDRVLDMMREAARAEAAVVATMQQKMTPAERRKKAKRSK